MEKNSRAISSVQSGVHDDLPALVARHLAHPFRKPILDYNRAAFAQFDAARQNWNPDAPLLLDSGCGVGWSTLQLAAQYPEHFVVGVDQSSDRIGRGKPGATPANACFIRADVVDFWRLLLPEVDSGRIRLSHHFLLYPNPWPKIGHLARRWHGHAIFPTLVALGGRLECRSNWGIYIEELAAALRLAGQGAVESGVFVPPGEPLTPFEAKYAASGQTLYRLVAELG